jgi:UDP-MurNAc hydroxylase
MTTLTYLGHASFFFETEKAAVLIDPWLSPNGAFLGTWRQLPPNQHCLDWVREKMKSKPSVIYITHEHEDHYDEDTLKQLLPYAKALYIPRYENTFLKKLIEKNLGVAPKLLDENMFEPFHDISFKIFIDESGINRDSAIFLKSAGLSFLDVNDCKIYDRATWLREQCGAIDLLSCQFSGANMHPICYDMDEKAYAQVSRQKKMRKFVAVRNFMSDLKPSCYLPSAGPAVFAKEEHFHLNFEKESIFPKWWEFREYLREKKLETPFVPLAPGGTATKNADGEFTFAGQAEKLSDEDIAQIVSYYRTIDAALPAAKPPSREEVLKYFEAEMNKKIGALKNNPAVKLGCPFYFRIVQENHAPVTYLIHHDRLQLETAGNETPPEPYYLHTGRIDALELLLRSGKGWGTYFLSFLFRSKRAPDVFDSVLGTFFVANDADDLDFGLKKLAEFRDSKEYITLSSPDGQATVTCKRFCPHQGGDLKYAKFDGRYVVCPRHQWKFDCEAGGKADNSSDSIDALLTKTGTKTARSP